MSITVLPFGTRGIEAHAPSGRSADVVDLASRRPAAAEVPAIPDEVLDEVEASAQRWHDIRRSNRELSFDADPAGGPVVASLRDLDSGVVRALPLRGVLEAGELDGPESAA